jgi:hypothetical protein
MNARKAKLIRKEVYGNLSKRQPLFYQRNEKGMIINRPGTYRFIYLQIKRQSR